MLKEMQQKSVRRSASSRRRGETLILTDTPIKRKFEEKAKAKQASREKPKKLKKSSEDRRMEGTESKSSRKNNSKAKKLQFRKYMKSRRDDDSESIWKCFSCGVVYGEQGDIRICDK